MKTGERKRRTETGKWKIESGETDKILHRTTVSKIKYRIFVQN